MHPNQPHKQRSHIFEKETEGTMRDDEDDDYMSDRHLARNISLTLRHTLDCEQYAQREREEALDMTGGSDADFYADIAIGLEGVADDLRKTRRKLRDLYDRLTKTEEE